jgi:Xaa-Pro dipeptidase
MIEQWTPEWSTPVFSVAERERRWQKVRQLMARDGIDVVVCLPNTNRRDRGQQDSRYLTQLGENCEETTVVFPLGGEVTAWQTRAGATPSSNWLSDIRAARYGAGAEVVIARLQELGREHAKIGIAGLTGSLLARTRAPEGEANWQSVEMIKSAFPNASVCSATETLAHARYQKSDEEIAFIKKGVEIAEKSLQAVLKHARAGVAEREVYAHMLYASAAAGGSMPVMFGWISGSLGKTYTRLEQPSFRSFLDGDVLLCEIEGRWAGYIGQIDQAFSIGRAHTDFKDANQLAWESFNRVQSVLRPGITVRELIDAGAVRGMNGRGSANLTMHGRGTGDDGPLVTPRSRSPAVLALEIKEGCCLIIKPDTAVDGHPNYGRWGDCVVVRERGAERLGIRGQETYELM